jgi:hypothetical protein
MSQHDKENLVFLLSLSHDGLHQWFYQASEDDIAYAEELMAQAHIMAIDARVAQLPQYREAQEVLKPFLL